MHARVKDIMTTDVVMVGPDAPYRRLAGLLRAHRISSFPVVDDNGVVVGLVSESDLLAEETPGVRPRRKHATNATLTAGDLMTRPVVTTSPDELVSNVARLMSSHKLRRLPVIDAGGRLVGIVSRADVLHVFSRPDEEIRREITQDVIADMFFTDPDRLTVTVKDGIVTLAGALGSVVLGANIVDQAEHVEGVVTVRDHFTCRHASLACTREPTGLGSHPGASGSDQGAGFAREQRLSVAEAADGRELAGRLDEAADGIDLGPHRPGREVTRPQLGGRGPADRPGLRGTVPVLNLCHVGEQQERVGFQLAGQQRSGQVLVHHRFHAPGVPGAVHGHDGHAAPAGTDNDGLPVEQHADNGQI